jgi:hypothetical protein
MRHSTLRSWFDQNDAHAELTPVGKDLAFTSSFNRALVDEFKRRIPRESRRWEPDTKRWLVSAQYGSVCAQLAQRYLGVTVTVPQIAAVVKTETKLLRLEYLGRCKDREGGESSAFGWVSGSWSMIVPEAVLREWFEAVPQKPGEKPTFYAILGIKPAATIDELRSAYRRMARQWHPDVCREPDAAEQFKLIQGAYEVLGDELKRRKYDAGLKLEASLKRPNEMPIEPWLQAGGYRPPLRCGWVLCEGQESLGRFVVTKILEWQDIIDSRGRVMVTSWAMGADTFSVAWQ